MKIIVELPFDSETCGGVIESKKLAYHLGAELFFQRQHSYSHMKYPYKNFPACDVVISYSDNPFLQQLVKLPQVGKVMLNMLSYGMSIDNERRNVFTEGVTVMCSTKKIEDAIIADDGKVHRIGFALDMDDMYDYGEKRDNLLAIYYHPMPSKRYDLSVKIANELLEEGVIDDVISFGVADGYDKHKHPNKVIHYTNASREQVRDIFNKCKCFLMPSISEGLNLTPIEATLCGCQSVICDGAINEIFNATYNCHIVEKDNKDILYWFTKNSFDELYNIRDLFMNNMRETVNQFTWDKVVNNIKKLI